MKENKGGRKSYDKKNGNNIIKDDIVTRNWRERVMKEKILLNCYTFGPVLTKTKHTPIHISWTDEQLCRRVKARTIKNIIINTVINKVIVFQA